VTRKKTTTGTMGSKRKTETKVETKAKEKPAEKAAPPKRAEQKANEVIPEVAVALLEAHPALPDQALILEEFSQHFRSAAARAEALASASAAAAQAAPASDSDKQRKRRTTVEAPARLSPRATSSYEPPVVAAPAVSSVAAGAPVYESTEDVSSALEDEPAHALVASEPEPEEPSVFAALEAEATREPEDLFALLAADPTTSRASDDDFDFGYQTASDQSSPFLAAAPLRDDSATVMVSAVDDDAIFGTPIAQEALPVEAPATVAPTESTMMIQAMPDEEPADGPADTRKSRKSTKKRRG